MHCFFFQEPILKIWLQIVVKAGAINFDALHQLLYLLFFFSVSASAATPVNKCQRALYWAGKEEEEETNPVVVSDARSRIEHC